MKHLIAQQFKSTFFPEDAEYKWQYASVVFELYSENLLSSISIANNKSTGIFRLQNEEFSSSTEFNFKHGKILDESGHIILDLGAYQSDSAVFIPLDKEENDEFTFTSFQYNYPKKMELETPYKSIETIKTMQHTKWNTGEIKETISHFGKGIGLLHTQNMIYDQKGRLAIVESSSLESHNF